MALTPQVRASQVKVTAVAEGDPDIRVSQAVVRAVAIYPTEFIQDSQVSVRALTVADTTLRVSQARVRVVGRGRVQDPYLRVWSFELDDHWFYVERLPTGYTLVYDLFAEQWYIWASGTGLTWRPTHGINWLGSGPLMGTYGTNILCGDDGNGAIYLLNPNSPTDDDAIAGSTLQRVFTRVINGQVTVRGNDYHPCYSVELMGSIGDNELDLTDVRLETSDDVGHTYDDQGTVSVSAGDYAARVDWNSGLGSYTGPGRLFRITDTALQRIDYLDMNNGSEKDEKGG